MRRKLALILALFFCVISTGDVDFSRAAASPEDNIRLPIVVNPLIYYVDGVQGKDTNPGTISKPWLTIQKAADTMVAGDMLIVRAGNYTNQRVSITHAGNSTSQITYQAQGQVLMKGFSISADYVTVTGFEVTNTDYHRWGYQNSAGIYVNGSYNTIENNYIHDASLEGIYLDGSSNTIRNNRLFQNELAGIEVHGQNSLIEGNDVWSSVQCHPNVAKIEGTNCSSVSGLDADGMRFFGSGHTFRKNKIHDILLSYTINGVRVNINPHIDCFQTWNGEFFVVGKNIIFEQNYCENYDGTSAFMLEGGADHLYIRNNIFRTATGISANGNGAGGADYLYIFNNIWAGKQSLDGSNYPTTLKMENINHVWVENNIFYDQSDTTAFFLGNTANTIFDYNLTYNSNGSKQHCIEWGSYNSCMPASGHNLLDVNPQFVNPASNDYHLKSTSPAIDAGCNLYNVVTSDFDGISRPQGPGYDIGAFEFFKR